MSVPAGPPSGGLYLNPPSGGGLCDGVTTIPSARGPVPVALCARIARDTAGVGVYPPRASTMTTDLVGREHLQRADLRRLGQRVRVGAQVQRAVDPLAGPVLADRLGGGQDVVLVERRRERGSAMPRRAERHPLHRIAGIGMHRVVGGDQLRDVYQVFSGSGLPGARVCHAAILARRAGAGQPGKTLRTRWPQRLASAFARLLASRSRTISSALRPSAPPAMNGPCAPGRRLRRARAAPRAVSAPRPGCVLGHPAQPRDVTDDVHAERLDTAGHLGADLGGPGQGPGRRRDSRLVG